jgi:hypothetical protein
LPRDFFIFFAGGYEQIFFMRRCDRGAADCALRRCRRRDPSWGPAVYNWSGFYAGAVAGAAWGQYDPRTATDPQTAAIGAGYLDAANAAAVTAAGTQSIETNGFVTGLEGGYNWQTGQWLVGLEADLEAVHLLGQTNSGAIAYPGGRASLWNAG